MADKDWRVILEALEGLPSGLPSEHVAVMARWFQNQMETADPGEVSVSAASPVDHCLGGLSFADVRRRMERLGSSSNLRAQEKALLCAWVWSLAGDQEFCSNDAQKLYGEKGGNLNAHHFNQQAGDPSEPSSGSLRLIRTGKGRYRFTDSGREEGEWLAREHLLSPVAAGSDGNEST